MTITYYDLSESELAAKEFEAGAIYCCTDTGSWYVDSVREGTRKKCGSEIIFIETEAAREEILAPLPGKIYCVLGSRRFYIFCDLGWITVGGADPITIYDIVVEYGTLTIERDGITPTHIGKFYPDPSVQDLVRSNTVTCTSGSAVITLDTDYPIPGVLHLEVV